MGRKSLLPFVSITTTDDRFAHQNRLTLSKEIEKIGWENSYLAVWNETWRLLLWMEFVDSLFKRKPRDSQFLRKLVDSPFGRKLLDSSFWNKSLYLPFEGKPVDSLNGRKLVHYPFGKQTHRLAVRKETHAAGRVLRLGQPSADKPMVIGQTGTCATVPVACKVSGRGVCQTFNDPSAGSKRQPSIS